MKPWNSVMIQFVPDGGGILATFEGLEHALPAGFEFEEAGHFENNQPVMCVWRLLRNAIPQNGRASALIEKDESKRVGP
jgi:hypothetical protein